MTESNTTDSLESVKTAAERQGDEIDKLFDLASEYADKEQWRLAGETYENILHLAPDNSAAFNGLGTVFEGQGDIGTAEKYYRKALAKRADNAEAYANLAALYDSQFRSAEAYEAYQQVLRLSTDADELQEARTKIAELLARRQQAATFSKQMLGRAQWSLVIGFISIFANGVFDAAWGIAMIGIALLMWRVRIPATLLVYAVMMAWAAIWNIVNALLDGGSAWFGAGAFQIYWAFVLFNDYRRLNRLPAQEFLAIHAKTNLAAPTEQVKRITGRYAVGGAALGVFALATIPGFFACAILSGALGLNISSNLLGRLLVSVPDVAALALGFCIAAFFSMKYRRAWAIGGMTASVLAVAAFAGVLVMFR